jgi:type IV pilus assembly protein PilQ
LGMPNVHIYDVKENADGLTFYVASQPLMVAAEPELTEIAATEAAMPVPEEETVPEAEPTPVAMGMIPAAEAAAIEAPMEMAQAEPMAAPEEEIPPMEEAFEEPALIEQPITEEMPVDVEAPVEEEYPPLEILPPGEEIPTKPVAPVPARPVTVEGIDFKQMEGKSRIVVTTSAPASYDVASGPGDLVKLTISRATLLPRLKRILDTSEFDSPIIKIVPGVEGRQVIANVYLHEMVPYVASQDGNEINIDFSKTRVFKEPTPPPAMVKLEQGVIEEMAPVAQEVPVMEPIPPAPMEVVEEIPPAPAKEIAAPPEERSLLPVTSARVPVITQVPAEEYTGQRISLDFQDADIHNILRLIADISNVNIIAGDDVKGRVTLKLKDVPWDQALEIILETNGLGVLKKGNIYRIAKREKILAEKKAMIAVEDTHTIMIPLNYASAKDVASKVKGLGLLSERGNIKVDDRTNRIIVTDVRGNLENIRKLVIDLDLPIPQVLIEARIVEVNSNYARELGIQWGGQYNADSAHGNPLPYDFPNSMAVAGDAGGNYAINLPAAAGQGSGGAMAFTFGHIADTLTLDLRLSALENLNEGRVISSPRVTTLNKKKAVIAQGAEIPYSTRTAEGTDVAFKKAELSLQVTPYVNANNSIILKIKVNKDAPDPALQSFEGVPGLATKSATTEVLVNDGDTTVIGGIYTSDQSNNQQGIPVLSNIPILGYLFRFQGKSTSKQELLIFITPRVIQNEFVEREPIDLGITNKAVTN